MTGQWHSGDSAGRRPGALRGRPFRLSKGYTSKLASGPSFLADQPPPSPPGRAPKAALALTPPDGLRHGPLGLAPPAEGVRQAADALCGPRSKSKFLSPNHGEEGRRHLRDCRI